MDRLTFTTEIVKALAWPAGIVALIVLLKRELGVMARPLKRLKYGELEAEFSEKLKQVEEKAAVSVAAFPLRPGPVEATLAIDKIFAGTPQRSVADAFERTTRAIRDAAAFIVDQPIPAEIPPLEEAIKTLVDREVLSTKQVDTFNSLREVVNMANSPEFSGRITWEDSRRVEDVANSLSAYLHGFSAGQLMVMKQRMKEHRTDAAASSPDNSGCPRPASASDTH